MKSDLRCRIGTRKSALARTQSKTVLAALEKQGLECTLVEIVSEGDLDRKNPLYAMETGSPGLFCKQLEDALLAGTIDIAVHSLKDLPTTQPTPLFVPAVTTRESVEDWLLVHPAKMEKSLPLGLVPGAVVGTSSLRREAQLLAVRPDLKIVSLRGNVPTRVAQVKSGKLDGIVLAAAGLRRLGLELPGVVTHRLSLEEFVPAPGQGALGIEARLDAHPLLLEKVRTLCDPSAQVAVGLERQVMKELEGGCTLPFGALCTPQKGGWRMQAFLGLYRGEAQRDWFGFHRFDISSTNEETLVAKTVEFFRGKLKENG